MKLKMPSVRTFFTGALISFALLTLLLFFLNPYVSRFYPLGEDRGASWYFWQLPNPTLLGRIAVWSGYLLHQISIWYLLFRARNEKPEKGRVGRFNLIVLAVNLIFVLLHQLQTLFFYDGLALDVPIWTSQGSVILMLIIILFLMFPKRGLFFGKKIDPPAKLYRFIRKYHGIYISWALVYTFWFHPMEGNWGMISGFVYMFLLFIQLSLFHTPLHKEALWIVLLESFVAIHGALITVYKEAGHMMESGGDHIWAMFLFGFLFLFAFTQVWGLRWPLWTKWGSLILFFLSIAGVYGTIRDISKVYEVLFIPTALYGGALLLWLMGALMERRKSKG